MPANATDAKDAHPAARTTHAPSHKTGEHAAGAHHAPWWLELGFAILSVAVALGSMRFAWSLYAQHPDRPASLLKQYAPGGSKAASAGGVFYRWAYNKYYVDEIYEATVIELVRQLSRGSGWFDKYVVDGLVNLLGYILLVVRWGAGLFDKYIVDGVTFLGFAKFVAWFGDRIRGLQSGDLQGYLRWVGYGALATIGFYVLVISK
jgi:NADH-quinone oxidoreductase subunit L